MFASSTFKWPSISGLSVLGGLAPGFGSGVSVSPYLEAVYRLEGRRYGFHVGAMYTPGAAMVSLPVKLSYDYEPFRLLAAFLPGMPEAVRIAAERTRAHAYLGTDILILPPAATKPVSPSGASFINPMLGLGSAYYFADNLGAFLDIAGIYTVLQADVSGKSVTANAFSVQSIIGAVWSF